MTSRRDRFLFNISGPYGAGKDVMLRAILDRHEAEVHRVHSLTTRPISDHDGPWYEGATPEQFYHRTARGRWVVTRQLSGSVLYAISLDEIESAAAAGLACIVSVFAGPRGAGRLRSVFGRHVLSVGLLVSTADPDTQLAILRELMVMRGRDNLADVDLRIRHQPEQIRYVGTNPVVQTPNGPMRVFDEIVVNDDLALSRGRILSLFQTAVLQRQD